MRLSPEQQAKMLADTRDAAVAFLEELHHFREIIEREETSPGELRRASVPLRRLLIDRDLKRRRCASYRTHNTFSP